jgi:hypothetical protein
MGIEHMHDVQFIGTRQILKGPNRFIRMIGTVDSEQNFHNITFSLSVCGCRHPVSLADIYWQSAGQKKTKYTTIARPKPIAPSRSH